MMMDGGGERGERGRDGATIAARSGPAARDDVAAPLTSPVGDRSTSPLALSGKSNVSHWATPTPILLSTPILTSPTSRTLESVRLEPLETPPLTPRLKAADEAKVRTMSVAGIKGQINHALKGMRRIVGAVNGGGGKQSSGKISTAAGARDRQVNGKPRKKQEKQQQQLISHQLCSDSGLSEEGKRAKTRVRAGAEDAIQPTSSIPPSLCGRSAAGGSTTSHGAELTSIDDVENRRGGDAGVGSSGGFPASSPLGGTRVTSPRSTARDPEAAHRAELESAFRKFDKNNDGKITKEELRDVLRSLGDDPSDEDLTFMIQEVDKNGDGVIDLEEFVSLNTVDARQRERELQAAFDIFDKDKNGFISARELYDVLVKLDENCPITLEEVKMMIERVDSNGDGCVDYTEFKKMMERDIEIAASQQVVASHRACQ